MRTEIRDMRSWSEELEFIYNNRDNVAVFEKKEKKPKQSKYLRKGFFEKRTFKVFKCSWVQTDDDGNIIKTCNRDAPTLYDNIDKNPPKCEMHSANNKNHLTIHDKELMKLIPRI